MKTTAVVRVIIMTAVLIVASLFSKTGFSKTGFESGENFEAHDINGHVTVYCMQNGRNTVTHQFCRASVITPSGWQYFFGDEGVAADQVTFRSTQASGKAREKKAKYDASKNRTKRRVNLWTNTLLQKSLLDFGENAIEYAFLLDGQPIESGDLIATVNHGEDLECEDRTYYIQGFDCRGPDICTRYFRDENNCEY